MATFDPATFLNVTYNDSVDTKRTPIPVGEYTGQIGTTPDDIAFDSGVSQKNNKPWARIDVNITIPDPSGSIKAATGRDPVVVRDGVMVDLTPDGKLDFSTGKNIRLGKLLEAAGWPTDDKGRLTPGWSFGFLLGKQVKIKITQEPNPNDATQMYERVAAVTKP